MTEEESYILKLGLRITPLDCPLPEKNVLDIGIQKHLLWYTKLPELEIIGGCISMMMDVICTPLT